MYAENLLTTTKSSTLTGYNLSQAAPLSDSSYFSALVMPAIMATDELIVLQGTTTSTIDNNLTLDPPSVIQCVSDRISISRSDSASYALSLLIHNWFKPGEGAAFNSRGAAC